MALAILPFHARASGAHPGLVCTKILLLLFATVLITLPLVNAAATVANASCSAGTVGSCLNTSATFSGTDLAQVTTVRIGLNFVDTALIKCESPTTTTTTVTCNLVVAASVRDGVYPVTLVMSDRTEVEAGSLLIGNFYEQESLPQWTSTTNSSVYRVTGQSSDWPSSGDTWSVSGTFDITSTYSIVFYNNQVKKVGESPGTPTCAPVKVTASALSCTITSASGVMGMYNFLVKDNSNNALLLGSSSLYMLAVNPPLPVVTGASGSCATSSASCVSGASLVISGTNFNHRSPEYQQFLVGVNSGQRSAIRLTPTAVDEHSITVAMDIKQDVAAGSYPIFVRLQVCAMSMMSPLYYVGNLVIGGDKSAAGFETGNAKAIGTTVVSGFCYDGYGLCRNATVTLTGTELASVASVLVGSTANEQALLPCPLAKAPTAHTVSCNLVVAASVRDGVYPVTLVMSDKTEVEAGSLAVGSFLEARRVAGWTSTTNSSVYRVTGQSSDWPSSGDTWSVSGTFDITSTYSIVFYNNQVKKVGESPGTPTCAPVKVTASALSCTITSASGVMGMYNFLVKDNSNNALLLGSSSLYMLAVNPPLPVVTGASGSCATSSASCVSGASLVISGTNFNHRSPEYQQFLVGVNSGQRSAIRLTPTAVDEHSITVAMDIKQDVAAGSYPIFVRLQVCAMGMMSPLHYVGNLVLGGASVEGFNMEDMNGEVEVPSFCGSRISGGYIAAILCACVFGVLCLFAVGTVVFMCVRERRERRRWGPREEYFSSHQFDGANGDVPMSKLAGATSRYED